MSVTPTTAASPQARGTLVIGQGITLNGTVRDAGKLVVEGKFDGALIDATALSIASGGTFTGETSVAEADIAGTMQGSLTARDSLTVRATGRILGEAKCRRLKVEDGGQVTGRIEMLTAPQQPGAQAPVVEAAA